MCDYQTGDARCYIELAVIGLVRADTSATCDILIVYAVGCAVDTEAGVGNPFPN